jgi:hypothetical protein
MSDQAGSRGDSAHSLFDIVEQRTGNFGVTGDSQPDRHKQRRSLFVPNSSPFQPQGCIRRKTMRPVEVAINATLERTIWNKTQTSTRRWWRNGIRPPPHIMVDSTEGQTS